MKRKIVIEEYHEGGSHAAPQDGRSRWERVVDFFCGAPEHGDFYPKSKKRKYFLDGTTLKSQSFSNGMLFGDCMHRSCDQRKCLAIECFTPTDESDAKVFRAFLRVHNTAVSCGDLEVATEYRELLESTRSDICRSCKALSNTTGLHATNDDGDAPGSHDPLQATTAEHEGHTHTSTESPPPAAQDSKDGTRDAHGAHEAHAPSPEIQSNGVRQLPERPTRRQ